MKISLTLLFTLTLLSFIYAEEEKKDVMQVEYNSIGPLPTHGVTIAAALRTQGITPEKIDYLKLVGDESSFTSGQERKVIIDEWFWDRYFETAEPYKFWVSSGNRHLEIYLKGESKPRATIYINETDSCGTDDDPRNLRYMCRGLHEWFMATLQSKDKKLETGAANKK